MSSTTTSWVCSGVRTWSCTWPGFSNRHTNHRLFLGPLLPHRLVRPALVPVIPDMPGLRFQALHTHDAAEAYRLAALQPVHGAFNIAADPVIDSNMLADCLEARILPVPTWSVRAALSAGWHLHLVPASPHLFDAVLRLPIMDTTRARTELGWSARGTSREAIIEFLQGLRRGAGKPTPPLSAKIPGGRAREIATGIGQRP